VPLGPLTNLAIALSKDPSIAGLVKEVILMGGAIYGGNVDQVAEFNIYVDPEAAQIVFNAGWPLTMVGLEIGRKALFKKHHLEMLKSSKNNELNEFAVRVLEYLMARSISRGSDGISLYDPTAVAAVIDRSLIRTEFCRVEIETRGEFTRGQTVINQQNVLNRKVRKGDHFAFNGEVAVNPNVNVAVDIDTERFIKLLLERLAGNA
jgi:inosine-uridine nucleoside N-ribohydrolase